MCEDVNLSGDLTDHNGEVQKEVLELWYRDPVECVQELLGNPMFEEVLSYAPERVFRDSNGVEREIQEMRTADMTAGTPSKGCDCGTSHSLI